MFASLSRGSSKATRSYICSSCRYNLLTAPNPPPLRLDGPSPARPASFSTSTAATYPKDGDQAPQPAAGTTEPVEQSKSPEGSSPTTFEIRRRKGKPIRRRGLHRIIANTNVTLLALRDSLLAEEQASQAEASAKTKQPSKTSKGKSSITRKYTVEQAICNTSPTVTEKKGKKATSKSEKKKTKKQAKGSSETGLTYADQTEGSTGPRITRVAGQPKMTLGRGSLDKIVGWTDDNPATTRRMLIEAIQAGRLPPKERRAVMKSLRASLLSRHESKAAVPFRRSLPGQSLKDAMLRPRPQGGDKPMLRPRLRSGDKFPIKRPGIEIPYKVGQPRAANTPPIRRDPPGPVASALGPRFLRGSMTAQEIETVKADELQLVPVDEGSLEVPKLAYGLDRVLFNSGVYQLQDPRSRVFNFDPYLQTIMPVNEFDFNALKQYVTSSRDTTLLSKALAEKKKYTGSTSSMTSALGHFHFLLSQWRLIHVGYLSKMFPVEYHTFTTLQRAPVSIFLRWRDGTYAIDADKEYDRSTILSMLGKSMEKLLTLPTKDFEKYRKTNSDQISEEERNEAEQFHYTTMGDFLMRSQLDAHDPRLPGTGMFDLKTRAVVSVRMDASAYEEGRGYQIRGRHGEWESFEREYYDMIRAAFLKYSLQVRMGRMDGIFVAYHNTERIFGFQYISLEEMDYALHGATDTRLGDAEFKLSVDLLNRVLDRATAKYPEKSLRIHFETRDAVTPFMYIFAEPIEEEEVERIQATNKSEIEEFERQVLGLENEELTDEQRKAQWDDLRARVEQSMEEDELDSERLMGDGEDDVDAMTEEERHQIQALVSSISLDEATHEEENEDSEEGVIDEELDESDENTEDAVEITQPAESEQGIEEVDATEEANDVENSEAEEVDGQAPDLAGEETSVEESGEDEATEAIEDELSTTQLEGVESEEANEHLSDEETPDQEDFVDEDASEHRVSSGRTKPKTKGKELMAMTLTIRNLINGKYVAQPDKDNYPPGAKWAVEYALAEVRDETRAEALYQACKLRRERIFAKRSDLSEDAWQNEFLDTIKNLSRQGREWRDEQKKVEADLPIKTLDSIIQKPSEHKEDARVQVDDKKP